MYDAVIVGASIAGCTTAVLMARAGLRVALIERNPDITAYKILCTHSIQGCANPIIERLGILPDLEAAGAVPNGLDIWTRYGRMQPSDPSLHGYNIRREKLDPLMRKLVMKTDGVDLLMGWSAQGLVRENGRIVGVEITESYGTATQSLFARLVVGADGRHSRIAELAQVKQTVKRNDRFGYAAHYRNLPMPSRTHSRFWMLEPDIGYAFPNDDDVTVLACMVHKDKLDTFKRNIEGSFNQFFENLPDAPDIARAERISPLVGVLDYPLYQRQVAKPGLALVGDAALSSDPLWGVGLGWAFESGAWLADLVSEPLRSNGNLDAALWHYQRKHWRKRVSHNYHIDSFAQRRHFTAIERLFFAAASHDKHIATEIRRFGAREIGYVQLGSPLNTARAIWVNARRLQSQTATQPA